MSTPVLLVTGFLGAGKTSLINRWLHQANGLRIAAIVNDFGAINIDEELLGDATETIIGLRNGCICCSLQGDLLRSLRLVLLAKPAPQAIVIEASGVADPRGIIESVMDRVLWQSIRLDTVVCVIDAQDITEQPQRMEDSLWRAQTSAADFLLISQTNGLTPQEQKTLREHLQQTWQKPCFFVEDAAALEIVLGGTDKHAHSSERHNLYQSAHGVQTASAHYTKHTDRFTSLEWRTSAPISLLAFQEALQAVSAGLLRAKGFLQFVEKPHKTYLYQLVGRRASFLPQDKRSDETGCKLVMIGEKNTFDAERALCELKKIQ